MARRTTKQARTAKMKKRKTSKGKPRSGAVRRDLRHVRELGGVALILAGAFLALVIYLGWSGGIAGSAAESGLQYLFGVMAYLTPPAFVIAGIYLIFPEAPRGPLGLQVGIGLLLAAFFLVFGANTLSLLGEEPAHEAYFQSGYFSSHGGIIGDGMYWVTGSLLGDAGSSVAVIFLLLSSLFLITGASVRVVLMATGAGARRAAVSAHRTTRQLGHTLTERRPSAGTGDGGGGVAVAAAGGGAALAESVPFGVDPQAVAERPALGEAAGLVDGESAPLDGAQTYPDIFGGKPALALVDPETGTGLAEAGEAEGKNAVQDDIFADIGDEPAAVQEELFPVTEEEKEQAAIYVLPERELLRKSTERKDSSGDSTSRVSRVLEETLSSFGIEARVVGTESGPRVTRYELQLAPGIKVNKVSTLKNDIAYALATTDIRILAPIPGKSAVGVEVPNVNPNMVTLGDIYKDFPQSSGPLMTWLGKDIAGKPVFADLAQMPHLLVAGTTGSGKSGCINCMVSSVLLRCTPDQVRMILIDPKRVELSHFEGIPHLLTPVVTVMKDATNVLANLVEEMESRYSQMQLARAKQLDELNKVRIRRDQKPLPYILLVVDELADLMMVAPSDVEGAIIRLAQKSRAVGIHLVLATQRPSVDVITGMIKANVPSRIAFAVSSQIDSRVILDTNGAESLLGQGDMLFRPLGSSQLRRVQGAYISEEEIKLLTDRCKSQKQPDFDFELLEGKEEESGDKLPADEDELLPDAMRLVVEAGSASVSILQRRLRVGYTRAGRLVDMLERRGVISGYEGSKPRRVLIGEDDLERILNDAPRSRHDSAATAADDDYGISPEDQDAAGYDDSLDQTQSSPEDDSY
ncbi:MAG: DNA translocase FtsK 4TM domain-containing protein [Actinobacteria bacterium]|nr:DNA translocase FtsK 4TM domain-containing protein [Actinomycetota bacterium]